MQSLLLQSVAENLLRLSFVLRSEFFHQLFIIYKKEQKNTISTLLLNKSVYA